MEKKEQYSVEFRLEAVKWVTEQGLSLSEAGRSRQPLRQKLQQHSDSVGDLAVAGEDGVDAEFGHGVVVEEGVQLAGVE